MRKEYKNQIHQEYEKWSGNYLKEVIERKKEFFTFSGIPVKPVYTPLDLGKAEFDYMKDLGFSGQYPFTRGRTRLVYRKNFWVRSQFSGFGDPHDANSRYKYILDKGQKGFSIALDLPTQSGYDSDHKLAHGEVGKCGVSISSIKDMEDLLDGIPLEKLEELSSDAKVISIIITAMLISIAKRRSVDIHNLKLRIQTDGLKDFIATGNYIFPPRAALRIITDMVQYCTKNFPNWAPITVCGYHIREAGSTAVQEVAFTMSNAIAYIESLLARGLNIDDFAPKFFLFFTSNMDFFEEIAKFRLARKLWSRLLKNRFGAKDPKSLAIRIVCYTAGSALTREEPLNNVMRVTMEALAAVLGGIDVLYLSSYDETYCLPSEEAMKLAMRTQQILAYESGISNTVDLMGGSYYVEWLTKQMEKQVLEYIKKIDEMGGSINAIENGYYDKILEHEAYKHQMDIEKKEKILIGNNYNIMAEKNRQPIEIFKTNPSAEKRQIEKLKKLREERDNLKVKRSLDKLKKIARGNDNLFPPILESVQSYATLGEICGILREIYGQYNEETHYF